MDLIDRFESKYIPEPNSGCWLWLEAPNGSNGYGMFHHNSIREKAHRFSYKVYIGDIPEGFNVLHKCDTPSCVNPDHLFLGTHQDNMSDKKDKGRAPHMGRDTHPMTKLSSKLCLEIQSKYSGKYGDIKRLAKEYDVNRNTITQALKYDVTYYT